MKLVIKNPDGTEETVEGNPDELGEFVKSRKKKDEAKREPKKDILHGKRGMDWLEEIGKMTRQMEYDDVGDCIARRYFKDHPDQKYAFISCPCRRCSVTISCHSGFDTRSVADVRYC